MKLEFHGHNERYTVEQSVMNLFPGERPVYEPIGPGDDAWAKITCRETGDCLRVTADLFSTAKAALTHMPPRSPVRISTGRASAATLWGPASIWPGGRWGCRICPGACSPASGPINR